MKLPRHVDRIRREMWSRFVKYFYRDTAGGPENAILVVGVARSGTTWLAEVLASQLRSRLMFEPFNTERVDAYRAFEYVQYMRPDEDAPVLNDFVEAVLRGGIRDPAWVDRMGTVLRPASRIVKAVRACLMLRWIHDRFPRTPAVLIVRHPCAVAASFAKLGWSARPDLDSILRQPQLLDDHLGDVAGLLGSSHSAHEETALVWCVNHRIALRQCAGSSVIRVHYEDLVSDGEREFERIFDAIGRGLDRSPVHRRLRPSRTAKEDFRAGEKRGGEPAWRRTLADRQVADIDRIVTRFGLAHLYDGEGRPTGTLHEDSGERW